LRTPSGASAEVEYQGHNPFANAWPIQPASADSSSHQLAPCADLGIHHRTSRWHRLLLDAPQVRAGMELLVEALIYARYAKRDISEFAVEIGSLRGVGLSHSDLRWLVCRGYVQHAEETTSLRDRARSFRHGTNLAFTDRTCFVPTKKGALAAKHLAAARAQPVAEFSRPRWNSELHELYFHGELVKRYTRPSPNQELILEAFQEEGWPPRIDDPLPPAPDQDPKQRIRDAIKNLNRHQNRPLIRFQGDGTGQGVRWTALSMEQPSSSSSSSDTVVGPADAWTADTRPWPPTPPSSATA
jgi:hypothetical protein